MPNIDTKALRAEADALRQKARELIQTADEHDIAEWSNKTGFMLVHALSRGDICTKLRGLLGAGIVKRTFTRVKF